MNPAVVALVESVFTRLIVRYGRDFLAQYEGVNPDLVKADWAVQLGGFMVLNEHEWSAPAVHYALEHLPEKPMNAAVFRRLCQGFTPPGTKLLPHQPRKPPQAILDQMARIAAQPRDERPARVRTAEAYLKAHPGPKFNPVEKSMVQHYRRVLEMWERSAAFVEWEEAQRKAAAETACN